MLYKQGNSPLMCSVYSCLPCTKVVRGGSLWLNQKELAYRYPTHLGPLMKMRF